MKLNRIYCILIIIIGIIYSCNSNKKETIIEHNSKDSTQNKKTTISSNLNKDNVQFFIDDTIKKSKAYFFSSSDSKDTFLLTINPGNTENSTSEFKIITEKNEIIYQETFRTHYFLRGIDEPATIPTGSQKEYEQYMAKYKKSLTLNQYKSYFKNSLDNFFDGAVYPVKKSTYEEIKDWEEEIEDKEFLNEVFTDSTVNIIDLTCFDCDEGGQIIGYSKAKKTVKSLLAHD